MDKIIVIGGGIAGLAAGIYARKEGFECEIYERHNIVGGQCTGWNRNGFHIDNCVHWMTGTSPEKEIYKVWEDVGALGDGIEIIQHDKFLTVEQDGKKLHVWKDVNRLEKELLAFAPEDSKEIKHFCKMLRAFSHMEVPALKPKEQMGFMGNMRYVKKILPVLPYAAKYNSVPITEYIKRFKNKMVQDLILSYLPSSFNTVGILYMYGTFLSGNGALPKGGSIGIATRMRKKFLSLGGTILTNKTITQITEKEGKITSALCSDGQEIAGNHFIFACDSDTTYQIVGKQHMDEFFAKRYSDSDTYPTFSSFNVYLSCDKKAEELTNMVLFKCKPIDILGGMHDTIAIKSFDYEPTFAPEGKSVLQIMILQDEKDYDNWETLHKTKDEYNKAKQQIAETIIERIYAQYPSLQGSLQVIEVVTPYSYNKLLGTYKGAYMSFITTHKTKREVHSGRIQGLSNAYIAGQWTLPPGGLPNAVVSGKFAIQRIIQDLQK